MPPAAADLIAALLTPELAMLAVLDPAAASERRRRMTSDAVDFSRGSLALDLHWLIAHAGSGAPWTWAIGDAHQGNFCTLATGALKRDGRTPVTYGVGDVDDEHPAPWHWDLLRLLASVATARPGLSRPAFAALAAAGIGEYARTMTRIGDDDAEAALRIDLHGLPEALKPLIERDNEDQRRTAHLNRHVIGSGRQARLRPGEHLTADHPARIALLPALQRALAKLVGLPEHELLDLAARPGHFGLSSLGRRRWLALLRERDRDGAWRLRLLELKERRPSVLSRAIPLTPFAPHGAPPRSLTVAMGGDPYQCVLHAAAGDYLVRTRCHARNVVELAGLDAGDLRRLAMLWGQLIAGFHTAGLSALTADARIAAREVAADAQHRARTLPGLAWALAAAGRQAFAAFRLTGRHAPR